MEYEALIVGLGLARKFEDTTLNITSDSQLLINQVNSTYAAKCPTMAKYFQKVQDLVIGLEKVELKQLSREDNGHADALTNLAYVVRLTDMRAIEIKFLMERSILESSEVLNVGEEELTWMKENVD